VKTHVLCYLAAAHVTLILSLVLVVCPILSGNNTLYATLLKPGGISATYYDGVGFTDPMKYAEGTNALQKLQFKETAASNNEFSIPTIDGFSVRWVGHIAPGMPSAAAVAAFVTALCHVIVQ
jgi:hypothetical protein